MSYQRCPKHNEPMTDHGCSSCFAEAIPEGENRATMRLPSYFLMDHIDRDLPSPYIVKWGPTRGYRPAYAIVYAQDPSLSELESDADHYADPSGPDNCSRSLIASARATRDAIRKIEENKHA